MTRENAVRKVRTPAVVLALALLAGAATAQVGGRPDDTGPPGAGGAGGGYTGPGDTVPGGGTGGGTGGVPTQPGQPTRPVGPLGPSGPGFPLQPPPGSPGDPTGSDTETTGGRPLVPGPESWQLWWFYNRWDHLELGSGAVDTSVGTGTGGFYLGRGQTTPEVPPLLRATRIQMRDLVAPSLLDVLENGGSNELVVHALLALARLRGLPPDPEHFDFSDAVRRSLRSGNLEVAEKAALALGVRGEARFFPWLQDLLEESPRARALTGRTSVPHRVRAFAAYALGMLATRADDVELEHRIHQTLAAALLRDERPEVHAACVHAIGTNPLSVGDAIGDAIGDDVGDAGLETSPTTGPSSRLGQIDLLLSVFVDESRPATVRSRAPRALALLCREVPEELRERVARALLAAIAPHAPHPDEVQIAAALALGSIGRAGPEPLDEEIRSELARVAFRSNTDRLARYVSRISLAEVSARPGRGLDPWTALEPTRRLLLRHLKRSRGTALAWSALALGLLEEDAAARGARPAPDVTAALRKAFDRNRSPEVAGALAIALGLLRDEEAQVLLTERLDESGESHVRGYCAIALGMIGSAHALPAVRSALERAVQQPFALERAAIALSLLGDQTTGATLFGILQEASNPDVQSALASALGWIRDPRPIAGLAMRLRDPRHGDVSRAWTAVALGRICDEDELPWVGRASVAVQYDVHLTSLIDVEFRTGLLDQP